ncbi:hypothetical protein GCM10011390_27640 [Aureimonas endophytica]|uniref:Uncharacterized protein n=1 Tax=Aureimonas endophytica TaxID=2027858 RepID=A0A916ZNZ7_9HYPH|nr:FxsA family protein [Aureimonas endophytica]GGE07067.1 hypothetical protein GCM10011390_27640 [Aureimonas endophytica]
MPLALIPICLLLVPILEITTFILVGGWIGLWPTLGLVVGSAVLGALLLRRQGLSTLQRIQTEIKAGRVPGRELVHGVIIVAAGVLLLTPGLVTDVFGYLLFVPKVRDLVWRALSRRVVVTASGQRRGGETGGGPSATRRPFGGPEVVDLGTEDYERRPDPNSPWNGSHEGNRTLH